MTLLAILYWLVLILSVIFQVFTHFVYTLPLALLALFIIIGLKIFRTTIE